ncbi:MAG: prenyltransferase [Bacillota bacterium]
MVIILLNKTFLKDLKFNINLFKDLWWASRPLSLTLAVYSTTVGIMAAYRQELLFQNDYLFDLYLIFIITAAGISVQTATNLINDFFECEIKYVTYNSQGDKKYQFLGKKRSAFDVLVFYLGICCFLLTALIGIHLVYLSTTKLLAVGILGLIGGYSYTGEPIVYKKRGLGTVLSFILMGPLMVFGSYLVFSQSFSWYPIIVGMPLSLMIPMLMLSNELRDYRRDQEWGIRTMTVRFGYKFSKNLFLFLLIFSYLLIIIYTIFDLLPIYSLLTLLTIPLAVKSYLTVAKTSREGVPTTNKLHLSFGLILILSMFF